MIYKFKTYMKEQLDYSDLDPYGEEDWEYDNLTPVLMEAKKQNKPFDQIKSLILSPPIGRQGQYQAYENLDGIEKLINLKSLDCHDNRILTTIDGIENLTNLNTLNFSNCQLTNLNAIENLIKLHTLNCNFNHITNLDVIKNLVNLNILHCSHNQLTNLHVIENLPKLETLTCRLNNFSNEYKEYLRKYCRNKNIYLEI